MTIAGKDASTEFDMIHRPDVVEKYAADATAASCRRNLLSQLVAVRKRKSLPTHRKIYCARHSWAAATVRFMLWLRMLLSPVTRAVDSLGAITVDYGILVSQLLAVRKRKISPHTDKSIVLDTVGQRTQCDVCHGYESY